ncbi:MAG: cytochrome P450 [Pseudonocardia sp.]|nr:cytochrome P450 [Pseudonocardia sp.]
MTPSRPSAPFDTADPAFLADPYPRFAALRAAAEIHPHPGLGMPVAVSHAACSAVLRGRDLGRIWADAEPADSFTAFNLLHRNSLLEREGPGHHRLRGLVASAFGRGHTARLRDWVHALAGRLVDDLASRIADDGAADLLGHVAAPLPVEVIAELLGVEGPERALLRGWSNTIVTMYEPEPGEERRAAAEKAAAEFVGALRELAAFRRRHPSDDLVSGLLAEAAADGSRISEDELVGTAALLLMAGHEATVNVIGNGVLALLRNPGEWARLEPALVPTAVEELIRFDAPLQLFERTALVDVEVAGFAVPAGTRIAALLGAAAHDPAVFTEPGRLDLRRHPNPHLGFGAGVHYCLGAPLARLEVGAALQALRDRLPGLTLAGEPPRRPDFVMRGLRSLPVTVVTSRRAPRGAGRPPGSPGAPPSAGRAAPSAGG